MKILYLNHNPEGYGTYFRCYHLARHIAASDPKIRRVFDAWKGTQALKSKLEQNQELKSALLEESPWVLEAQSETQARQRVGLLLRHCRSIKAIQHTLDSGCKLRRYGLENYLKIRKSRS